MFNLNKVELIGNIGSVEVVETTKKRAVVSIATNSSFKDDKGDKQERTTWHRITVWNPKLIDLIGANVAKGDYIRIVGELRSGTYKDQAGVEHRTADIVGTEVGFLSPKRKEKAEAA